MTASISSIKPIAVSTIQKRDCFNLDCLTRSKPIPIDPPIYSSLFIDVNAERVPISKDMARGLFTIPLVDSPRPPPIMPRRVPLSLHSKYVATSAISHMLDERIPLPPVPNPFNLPRLPARDYIEDKIKKDINRIKAETLHKLEEEIIEMFYQKASQEDSPRILYSRLFHGVIDIFNRNFSILKHQREK